MTSGEWVECRECQSARGGHEFRAFLPGTRDASLLTVDGVSRFEDLFTWQRMRELEAEVLKIASRSAIVRDVKFRSQLTDAAGSATRNVAEGFARYNPGEFARFLDISRASATEVRNCLITAQEAGYLSADEFLRLDHLAKRGLQSLAKLQRYLRSDAARRNARRYRYSRARNAPNDSNDSNDSNPSNDSNASNDSNDSNDSNA